jgi:hypothetical protein
LGCSEQIELRITINGEHVYGSPFYPAVLPAPTSSGHCRIDGEGKDVAVVGQTNEFTISACDQWDDLRGNCNGATGCQWVNVPY